jgi:hypothetical protein
VSLFIKNWSRHQHFKDRTPPWIKLYRELLDDPDWHELDSDAAKLLIGLWLIASEDETHQGMLPDARKLAFRLRITEAKLNQILTKLEGWLIRDDIKPISERYHGDAPETETETEKSALRQPVGLQTLIDLGVAEQHAKDWLKVRKAKRAPLTQTVIDDIRAQADKAGISFPKAIEICAKKSWQGFNASWDFGDTKTQDDWRKEINES